LLIKKYAHVLIIQRSDPYTFGRINLRIMQNSLHCSRTTDQRSEELKAEIEKRHPYEIPEVVELKMNDVSESYVAWMALSTNSVI